MIVWRTSAVSGTAKYVLHRIFCQQHNSYLNRPVLGHLAGEAGFTIVDHQGDEFPLDPLRESPWLVAGLRLVHGAKKLLGSRSEPHLLAGKPA